MASNEIPVELERLREDVRLTPVFYEIFPPRPDPALDMTVDWFEIVLHAEADARRPLDGWAGQAAIALLKELIEFLVNQTVDQSCERTLSSWYYTASPPPADQPLATMRLFRSVSLVLFNLPAYSQDDESPLLTAIKSQLQKLNVASIQIAR